MSSPYKGQSTAKTIFLLASAVGWLIVGASLIYLTPAATNALRPSELTAIWMDTLGKSGYNPMLAIIGGGAALVLTVTANALWHQKFGSQKEF